MVRFAGDILIFRNISCFELTEIYPELLLKVFHASFLEDFCFHLFSFLLFTPTLSHPQKTQQRNTCDKKQTPWRIGRPLPLHAFMVPVLHNKKPTWRIIPFSKWLVTPYL